MKTVCIIPARGGSKRIPRKNIKLFRGKPLISWTIDLAIKSNCFDKIIVSTDDKEIAEISVLAGAEVPFLRPLNLSDDFTSSMDVMRYMVKNLKKDYTKLKNICCIYATAPLTSSKDINESFETYIKLNNNQIVFGATTFDYPIQRAITLDQNNNSSILNKNYLNSRSQDLKDTYHDAGQFYWGSMKAWLKTESILHGGRAFLVPRWRVQDIDMLEDWERAEQIHEILEANH